MQRANIYNFAHVAVSLEEFLGGRYENGRREKIRLGSLKKDLLTNEAFNRIWLSTLFTIF